MNRRVTDFLLIAAIAIGSLGWPVPGCSQEERDRSAARKDRSVAAKTDSVKSPQGAMLRSLIFPGWGQWYNHHRLKAVVVFGAEVGLLANSIYLNQKCQSSQTTLEREFYINNRNLSNWWLLGVILFSMADAFVDAHLYRFDEGPELSFWQCRPMISHSAGVGWACSLRISF
jgi:hypothetical protein